MTNITAKVLESNSVKLLPTEMTRLLAAVKMGLMKIDLVDDEDYDFDDLCGDMFNPDALPEDIDPEQLKKEKDAFRDRVHNEGVFGAVLYCRKYPSDEWVQLESIWGNVGTDIVGSGYDYDFVRIAHDWLHENIDVTEISQVIFDLM